MRAGLLERLGVAVTPTWLWTDEVEGGLFNPVLSSFDPATLHVQVVMLSNRLISARAVAEFMAAEFRADPRLAARGVASATIG